MLFNISTDIVDLKSIKKLIDCHNKQLIYKIFTAAEKTKPEKRKYPKTA